MAKVTNNHFTPLALPNGVVIPAKGSADVEGWDKLKSHGVVSKWLAAKILSVGGKASHDEPEPEAEPEVVEQVEFTEEQPAEEVAEEVEGVEVEEVEPEAEEAEFDEKEELINQLSALGVKADKRSSVEKLQEKLDEALAK